MSPNQNTPGNIAAVILAAGFSRRLGRPKQTLMLRGETLIARAVRIAHEASLSPVIVVTNPEAGFAPSLEGPHLLTIVNHEAFEGMASSIRCGVADAQSHAAAGVVLLTCDQVALTASHLVGLCEDPARITGSAYSGKTGIPAYFPAAAFPELLALQGDTGARHLLDDAFAIPAEDLALDIDTEADLQRAIGVL